jgi:hypothetical protein
LAHRAAEQIERDGRLYRAARDPEIGGRKRQCGTKMCMASVLVAVTATRIQNGACPRRARTGVLNQPRYSIRPTRIRRYALLRPPAASTMPEHRIDDRAGTA